MKKNTYLIIISVISIIFLLGVQIAWINLLIQKDKERFEIELQQTMQNVLSFILSKEIANKSTGELSIELIPLDPSQIPKNAIIKGSFDTKEYNPGKNLENFMVGTYIEDLLNENKLRIEPIDSLFKQEFALYSQIESYIMTIQKKDSTLRALHKENNISTILNNKGYTFVLPLGVSGKYSFETQVSYTPTSFTNQLLSLSILSAIAIIIISLLILYQLYRLKIKSDELISHKKVVNGIIHDMKSPLAYVYTQLGVFENQESDIERKNRFGVSKIRVKYLTDKIDMLLSALRNKGNKLNLQVSSYPFSQRCHEIMDELSTIYRNKQINYAIEPLEEINIKADPVYFDACVRNLLDNALKYSGNNPIINIRVEQNKNQVKIFFTDNGKGMFENEKKKVFEEFYRVHNTSSLKSHGIGLAFTKQIVEAHSGKIYIESTLGKGSIFTILLTQ